MFTLLYCIIFDKHILLEVAYVTAWVPCSILLNHVTLLGWGFQGFGEQCARKKTRRNWAETSTIREGNKRAGEGCLHHPFSGEKDNFENFAYFMFSFWVRPPLTYIYNHYRKRSISECLNIWKRCEAELWVIIMKPYGGLSFREMKNGRMNFFCHRRRLQHLELEFF